MSVEAHPAEPPNAEKSLSDPHPPSQTDTAGKDDTLNEDIRLLGRLLGDAVKEHEGLQAFERIETIRRRLVSSAV